MSPVGLTLTLTLIFVFMSPFLPSHARIFTFEMHHRFSEPVRKWSEKAGANFPAGSWPEKGSSQYYAEMVERDRIFRGRKISGIDGPLSFSEGNSTYRISSLGFLHYTTVSLGTPAMEFLVALDTGSDLFWVPCDCRNCAPTVRASYGSEFQVSIYSPKESSTSKNVTCSSSLCAHGDRCLGTFSNCPYTVSYVSADTSTSGILVEDVLHLATEDSDHDVVEAYITFGCGQVQTGSFLDSAAPNGLFGLGMEKISVPSILSTEGFIADSFSMCFGRDGIGRISFGDVGSPDQEETPFNLNPTHPSFTISVSQLRVGTTLIGLDFTALFDSGTSFTYLIDPIYSRVSESFHSQARESRHLPDSRIPFEYCYSMSPAANTSSIPSLSLTMKGGGQFAVYDPIIVISTKNEVLYCLAVLKSAELNIIGQNFMTGYRTVFNRERYVLGWKKFDCYEIEFSDEAPAKPRLGSAAPAVAAGIVDNYTSRSAGKTKNDARSSYPSPYHSGIMSILICFKFLAHSPLL